MRYLLLIHWDERAAATEGDRDEADAVAEHGKYIQALVAAGKMKDGMRLRPESDAVRVSVRDGRRRLVDGPFAETKEAIGGFYLLECDSLEEAIE